MDPRSRGYPRPAPSSPSFRESRPSARPAHDAGRGPAGTRRRSPGSPPRNTALSTSTTARWTILSSSDATPSGRIRPSGFGISTRRTGLARYFPDCTRPVQVLQVSPQVLLVLPPRHPVRARRRVPLQSVNDLPAAVPA